VQARQVKLVLAPEDFGGGDNVDGGLVTGTERLARDLGGDLTVEVIVKVNGQARKAPVEVLRRVANFARELGGRHVKDAGVEIVDFANNQTLREWIDLTEFGITRKEKVEIVDGEGNNIRIPSAIVAIRRAISRMERYLGE
jgi:hypothetical protein